MNRGVNNAAKKNANASLLGMDARSQTIMLWQVHH